MDESTGITLPYEQAAMRGDPLPSGLDYPDQVMYMELRLLYDSAKRKIITYDTGVLEKKKLLDEYRCFKFNWENGTRWTQILKNTENAISEYRKNRTLENADTLLRILEGMDCET